MPCRFAQNSKKLWRFRNWTAPRNLGSGRCLSYSYCSAARNTSLYAMPQSELVAAKAKLRGFVKDALRNTTPEGRERESEEIAKTVLESRSFREARRIGLYVSTSRLREVETSSIVGAALERTDCKVFLPKVEDRDSNMRMLHVSSMTDCLPVPPFQIPEPMDTYPDGQQREDCMEGPLDLVLMPGLGFEANGHRLGRGGGYYDAFVDRLLRRSTEKGWRRPLLVGLALRAQIVEGIPMDDHDHSVDVLVTADGAHVCSTEGAARWGAEGHS